LATFVQNHQPMKPLLFFLTILFFSCETKEKATPSAEETTQTTTYLLIRHAEKETHNPDDKNPNLTEEGETRAKQWAALFSEIELDAIYSTNTLRTKATATPTAIAKNLEIQLYESQPNHIENLLGDTAGKTVLIVGHSNTLHHIANTIIGKEKYPELPESEYSKLFVLVKQDALVKDFVLKVD
jgi:2,3-bisphosphoglycerate-dependent phosphoglycerate mutase